MARYDFICDACGNTRTVERKMANRNDPLECDHPDTDEVPLPPPSVMRRLISRGTGFALKGGGWFKDGYSNAVGNGQ
jgi:putative FmdB family regulatory protein